MLFDKSLLQKIIAAYKTVFVSKQWPDEKYKWIAVKHFQDNWDINASDFAAMLKQALAKTGNLLVSVNNFPARMITEFAEVAPEQVRAMFKELFDETQDIWQRVKSFKEKSQPLLDIHGKNAKNHYQGENTIFTYLWLRYPEKYYIYKISEIKEVAHELNSELVFKNGKYEDNIRNFIELYNAIRAELLKDDELKVLLKSQLTDNCYADEQLCTLTIDMGYYISRRYNKDDASEIWFPSDYTPGISVEDWVKLLNDPEVFNKNSLEIMARMQDFGGIATCKQLSDRYGESANFYNSGSSYLAKRIHEKTNCPVMAENTENSRWWPILYVGRHNEDKNIAGSYVWKLRPELAEALKQVDLSNIKLYANGENSTELIVENPMIAELKNLLKSSKQIILTGAPGTGKTYLAKQIAYALTGDNAESSPHIDFCQFHPSFDYTDFVEGLRPVDKGNGNIGFERKDGIFKAFCQKALKNYQDSQKSKQVIEAESSAQEKIDSFLNEAVEKQTRFKTTNGNEFYILEFNETQIFINVPQNASPILILSYQEILKIISENIDLQKAGDVKGIFSRTHNRQSDSYVYIICSEIRKQKNVISTVSQSQVKLENFVFIIDEINRGDISKIFGELFYAVDPGYRGKDGKVTTQYDNLIDETDLYYGGFYIPQNVYIIGTMNDIDRSVESMDFAIRRRFTWKEIEAKDAVGMWDDTIPEYKDEAFEKMTSLNEVIEQTESLSKAFHIGPAYFLKLKEYKGDFSKLWDLHIMPLLKEYLRGMFDAETALENLRTAYFGSSDSAEEE